MLLLESKVTQNAGVAIPPHPTNAAQVWNAASAINRGNLKPYSLRSLARQISSRFSQVSFHLLRPGNLLALRRLRDCYSEKCISPNPFLFAKSQFTKPSHCFYKKTKPAQISLCR